MVALRDLRLLRQEFVDQNKRASRFAGRVLAGAAEEIEKLQRLSTKRVSVKKDLKPGADKTAIYFELRLRAFIEGFIV